MLTRLLRPKGIRIAIGRFEQGLVASLASHIRLLNKVLWRLKHTRFN
jgi:hypothetical protein